MFNILIFCCVSFSNISCISSKFILFISWCIMINRLELLFLLYLLDWSTLLLLSGQVVCKVLLLQTNSGHLNHYNHHHKHKKGLLCFICSPWAYGWSPSFVSNFEHFEMVLLPEGNHRTIKDFDVVSLLYHLGQIPFVHHTRGCCLLSFQSQCAPYLPRMTATSRDHLRVSNYALIPGHLVSIL